MIVDGCRLSVVVCWFLVVGYLVVVCRLLVVVRLTFVGCCC